MIPNNTITFTYGNSSLIFNDDYTMNLIGNAKDKAESADKLIIKVPSRNTSKTCSRCGIIDKELKLINREFRCKACGFAADRDVNAAKNILTLGTSVAITK